MKEGARGIFMSKWSSCIAVHAAVHTSGNILQSINDGAQLFVQVIDNTYVYV